MDIKIAYFSFADIDNFGDILFSHIFKMEIEKRIPNAIINFYTPTNFSVEGINYQAYSREKVSKENYDALIVFGGEVIHLFDERTWKPIYLKNNKLLETPLPSDVIYDWVNINGPFKAWVSVGVRPFEEDADFQKTIDVIEKLNYISVRGALSKKILENNILQRNNTKINITPDMGWLFPNLLKKTNQKGKLYTRYVKDENYVIFQINNITQEESKEVSEYLLNFQNKNKIPIYLLPIIRPWEDEKYLRMINKQSGNNFQLLPNNLSILEIADIITHSKILLSSSLHGAITALAEGIPAGIINKWEGTKLQDIFGHQMRNNFLRHQLSDIPQLLDDLLSEEETGKDDLILYSNFMKNRLDKLFNSLTNKIQNGK